jgi:hypothetical protein
MKILETSSVLALLCGLVISVASAPANVAAQENPEAQAGRQGGRQRRRRKGHAVEWVTRHEQGYTAATRIGCRTLTKGLLIGTRDFTFAPLRADTIHQPASLAIIPFSGAQDAAGN